MRLFAIAVLYLFAFWNIAVFAWKEAAPKIVIDDVSKGSPAEKEGLRAGDRIVGWRLEAEDGSATVLFREGSWCDLEAFQQEFGPLGASLIRYRRGDQISQATVAQAPWGITVRPLLDATGEAIYEAGRKSLGAKDKKAAAARCVELARDLNARGLTEEACWYFLRALKLEPGPPDPDGSPAILAEVESAANAGHHPCGRDVTTEWVADWNRVQKRFPEAEKGFQYLVNQREKDGRPGLALSQALNRLGVVQRDRGNLDQAEQSFRRALEIQERLVQGRILLSDTLTYIGDVEWKKGDFTSAEEAHLRALEIRRRLDPESLKTAASLNNLGILAWERGDGVKAEKLQRESLYLKEKIGRDDLGIAVSLNNLAVILKDRGDLVGAEEMQRRSIAIRERVNPDNPALATNFLNLATLLHMRGDVEEAVRMVRRSLAIHEKGALGSREHSQTLGNLGVLLADFGDYEEAEECLIRAIQAYEKSAPENPDIAGFWFNLGLIKMNRGDLSGALRCLEDSWQRYMKIAPGGTWAALCLDEMAAILVEEGKLAEAEAMYLSTLPVWEELSPGTSWEADCLHNLGWLAERLGRLGEAEVYYCRALQSLESQKKRLGGSQIQRAAFGSSRQIFYRRYADLLVQTGEIDRALEVLERGRARVFLQMLAGREVAFDRDLPPELEARRRILEVESERLARTLSELSPTGDLAPIRSLRDAMREVDSKRRDVLGEVRAHAPRLAALQDPAPLSLPEIDRILEPGTLLISFSIGESDTLIFTMRRGWTSPRWARIPAGRTQLGTEVRRFRRLIEDRLPLEHNAHRLGTFLLGPVLTEVRAAERLLILPDGPLYYLPFGALRISMSGGGEGRGRYLVEEKPFQIAPSATVYGELVREAPAGAGDPIAVFAVSEGLAGGPSLRSIPGVFDEADAVTAAFPEGAEVFKGPDATAERVETIFAARFVHFACHGILDDSFPLDSALVLSPDAETGVQRDSGLLHAWEILEKVRLKTQMVVLSACNSGLGREMSGEGIIGLTRAFQYSGAQSVLSTLWSVEDRSTAILMGRFYGALARGIPKDESLREAQVSVIRDARAKIPATWGHGTTLTSAHPYYWGGFVLNGCR